MPNAHGRLIAALISTCQVRKITVGAVGFAALSVPSLLGAQQTPGSPILEAVAAPRLAVAGTSPLPDAPEPYSSSSSSSAAAPAPAQAGPQAEHSQAPGRGRITSVYDDFIDPTEIAPSLTASDKIVMGFKSSISPFAVIGWIGSATYSETFNRSPNYGQSFSEYGQRVGAAAAKASSQDVFTKSVFAPIFREDPRYYELGPSHTKTQRTIYAFTRVFVTKTDAGTPTVNFALLAGNLGGSALTQLYYPRVNRGPSEVATTFGTSLAGSAVGNLFSEFLSNAAEIIRLKHDIYR